MGFSGAEIGRYVLQKQTLEKEEGKREDEIAAEEWKRRGEAEETNRIEKAEERKGKKKQRKGRGK